MKETITKIYKPTLNLDDYKNYRKKNQTRNNKFGIQCKKCRINFWVFDQDLTKFTKCVSCRY